MNRSTRFLFGQPGDFASRHPRMMLTGLILLVLCAEKIADLVGGVL